MPGEIAGLDLGYTLIEVPELGRELVGPTRSQLCYYRIRNAGPQFANLRSI
jgi:hypothetical protein